MNDIIRELLLRTNAPHNLTLAYSKQKNAIVERVNKEVNRHLRAFAFHSTNLEAYKLCLPFVQRIINSSVHSSTGASPASLLFGNQLNLDRGILVKVSVRLNTRCHLLAFAAKVEKQLQATVSIQ